VDADAATNGFAAALAANAGKAVTAIGALTGVTTSFAADALATGTSAITDADAGVAVDVAIGATAGLTCATVRASGVFCAAGAVGTSLLAAA
jgi:hypothetical protein